MKESKYHCTGDSAVVHDVEFCLERAVQHHAVSQPSPARHISEEKKDRTY